MPMIENETFKSLIEVVREANAQKVIEINGQSYAIDGHGDVELLEDPSLPHAERLTTLDGLIEFIQYQKPQDAFLHVVSNSRVYLLGNLNSQGHRPIYAKVNAELPDFDFDEYHSQEKMIIALQAQFAETKDRNIIMRVVGNLKDEIVHQMTDDGVSQQVQIKSGAASVDNVQVPNPVSMRPYRTFLEVEQPESKFVFRMRDGGQSALYEADAGMWRLVAKKSIKEYLENELKNAGLKDIPVIA